MVQVILLIAPVILVAVLLELFGRRDRLVAALRSLRERSFAQKHMGAPPSGVHDGIEYWSKQSAEGAGAPATLTLTMLCPSTQILRVEKRKPGPPPLAPHPKQCETHDSEFDAKLIVFGGAGGVTPRALRDGENRIAIRRLFELGCTFLELDGTVLRAQWRGEEAAAGSAAPWFGAALSYMAAVRDNVAREKPAPPRRSLIQWGEPNRPVLRTAAAVFVVASLVGAAAFDQYPPVNLSALLAVALAISVAVCWRAYATGMEAAGALLMWDRIRLLVILLATYATVTALLLILNGFEDRGRSRIRSVRVIGSQRLGSYHRVALSGWDDDEPTLIRRINVPADLDGLLTPGETRLLVTTRPGRLSFEWVWSVKVAGELPLDPPPPPADPTPTPTPIATATLTRVRPSITPTAAPTATPAWPPTRPRLPAVAATRRPKRGSFEWDAGELRR